MSKVKIDFLNDGFQGVINSPEVARMIHAEGERMARAAGEGFIVRDHRANYGQSPRPTSTVRSESMAARRAEARDKALTRAIRGG